MSNSVWIPIVSEKDFIAIMEDKLDPKNIFDMVSKRVDELTPSEKAMYILLYKLK